MSFTESTPVTIHNHSTGPGDSSTVTLNAGPPPYDTIDTLGSDQFGDEVLGTAVLAGGNEVVISASIDNNVNYNGFSTYPGYSQVYETIIDNGVAATQTLALAGGSDFLGAPDGQDILKVVPLTGGDFVVVEEARTTGNPNLYFELFSSSGAEIGTATQINAASTDASELNDSFNLVPTSTNGFVVEWDEGNDFTGHFETFNVNGTTVTGLGDKQFHDGTNDGSDAFIGNVAVATNGNVIVATNESAGSGDFFSADLAIYNASGGTVVAPETFAAAEGSLLPNESSTTPGDTGNPLENSSTVPQFVALPSGGFLAVIANPTGPYDGVFFPGFNMYIQTISATGVFGTPELVETTTGNADNTLNPVALSNGDVVLDVGGHFDSNNVFDPGTYEVVNPSNVPANISTPVAMTPLFPSGVAPVEQVASTQASTTAQVVANTNQSGGRDQVFDSYYSADNNGGVFAALQSGIDTGYFGYGTLDANLYAADFDAASPTISSAAYDAANGKLTVTGTAFTSSVGDFSATALTLTGQDGTTYTLTGGTIEANPTSTTFIVDLSAADQLAIDGLLNDDGSSSVGTTTYNLAATSSFDTGGNADTTSAVTVGNALTPTITSVSFDYATGALTLTGTGFENEGGTGGLRLGDITLKGQGGATYTLSTANAAVTSETSASITLTGSNLTSVKTLFNANGTTSSGGTTYNLAATTGWDSDAGAAISTEGVTVSGILPTVSSIDITGSSPTNSSSDEFTVTYSEAMNPSTVLATNFSAATTGTVADTGIGISEVSTSVFHVTVNGVTGNGTLGLNLNSGTSEKDSYGNTIGSGHTGDQSYTIDMTPPTVSSIDRVGSTPNNASTDQFAVTFSESVTGVIASDFTATVNNTVADTGISVTPVSGSVYTVTVNGVTGDGTLGLNLTSAGTIQDLAGNDLSTSSFTGQVYTIEHTPPSVSSIDLVGSTPNNASSDAFTVTFSESVTGVVAGDFTPLPGGTVADTGVTVTPVSGSVYTVTVNGVTGDGTLGLDLNNSGTGIEDTAGNPISGGFTGGQTYTIDHGPEITAGLSVTGTEGASTGSVTVATFTDAAFTSPTIGDFTATINWGDGGPTSSGTITENAGVFSVAGVHTYAEEGSDQITVTVTDSNSIDATATDTATIADAPLTATPVAISGTEGASLTATVATFTDANPDAPLSDFTATINWGDGTTTTGTVTQPGGVGTGFDIGGTHTYAEEGSYTAVATITDVGGSTATATDTATIADAALTATAVAISGTEGAALTATVAILTDANPDAPLSDFTATINWGDGTTTTGTVTQPGGVGTGFDIGGTHTYAEEGSYTAVATITDVGGSTATATDTATIADAALTATPVAISGTEGAALTATVATLTDANPDAPLSDFTATINWGDGTTTTGTVTQPGGVGTGFDIGGTHTYAEEGSYTAVATITDVGGSTATATDTATIADAALTATAVAISGTEGAALTATVATFTDANPDGTVSDFTATINWGDGAPTSSGTVTENAGVFSVAGSHTYAEEGSYTPVVSIADVGGSTATATDTATIADAALTATAVAISGTEGAALTATVATLTDANPDAPLSDFTATINWGDGTTTTGTVTQPGGVGTGFDIGGTHTYAEESSYTAVATITDVGGSTATATDTATIADAALTATPVAISGTEGAALTATVATLTDANPDAPLSDFTATINWGDGTTTTGTVTQPGGVGTGFDIGDTHTYAEEGSYTAVATITDVGGSTATATDTATIADAALTATAVAISGTEGAALTATVATFTDANPDGTVSDFTATINWGDGAPTSSGTVTENAGVFSVAGSHTYAEEGSYTPVVSIADVGGSTATATDTATIADAALSASGVTIDGTEGASLTAKVATFTDANPDGTVSDFTATINWGDGTPTSSGTVTENAGVFSVAGSHTYAEEGSYTTVTTITDDGGSTAQANGSADVGTPPLSTTHDITVAEGASTGTVAAGDSDPDGDSVTVTALNGGTVGVPKAGTFGTLTLNANDTFSYTANNTGAINAAPAGTDPTDTFTYTVSDGDGGTAAEMLAIAVTRPPTITGAVANQSTLAEAPVKPFSGVTIGDPNAGATDTLTITLPDTSAKLGTLSGSGLTGSGPTYQLAGTAAAITTELDALSFTPVNGVPATSVINTFDLSDQSSAFATATTNDTTSVIDTDLAIPPTPAINFPNVANSNVDEWILTDGEFAANAQPGSIPSGYQVAGTGDFTGGGTSDILWQNPTTGDTQEWLINNGAWAGTVDLGSHPGNYQIAGVGDFTGNGIDDVLWTSTSSNGQVQTDIWELGSSGQWTASVSPGSHPAGYNVVGVGDFTGNGTDDILWQNSTTGDVDEWQIANGQWSASVDLGSHPGTGWTIAGVGDFTGNGIDDILWTNSNGPNGNIQVDIWELGSNGQWAASLTPGLGYHPPGYQVAAIGDFTGNGTDGVLWQDPSNGNVDEWVLGNNAQWAESVNLGTHPGNFQIAGTGSFVNGNSTSDILWQAAK